MPPTVTCYHMFVTGKPKYKVQYDYTSFRKYGKEIFLKFNVVWDGILVPVIPYTVIYLL